MQGMQQTSPGNLWWVGLQTIVGAVIATLVVRAAAMAVLDIPAAFPPLAASGPTIFFTVVGVLGGVGVFAAVCRLASPGAESEMSAAAGRRCRSCRRGT